MRRMVKWLAAPLVLITGYFLGPQTKYLPLDGKIKPYNGNLINIEAQIKQAEAKVSNIKPGNQSRIVWADSIRKTPYSVVFLHGWSASSREGDPVVQDFARRYGCNVYYPRLAGHGIEDSDVFKELQPQDLINSARNAISIGQQLGEKVIIMGSSTGCTLGAYIAAQNPGAIAALIFYSPNIAIADKTAALLSGPWGMQIARLAHGGSNYHTWEPETPEVYDYWSTTYRIEGLICLQTLLDRTMKQEVFHKIDIPIFTGYYYKNEKEKDSVISTDAIKTFMSSISTPEEQQWLVPFADVGSHVITCDIQCKDLDSIRHKTYAFAEQVLGMQSTE